MALNAQKFSGLGIKISSDETDWRFNGLDSENSRHIRKYSASRRNGNMRVAYCKAWGIGLVSYRDETAFSASSRSSVAVISAFKRS